MRLEALAGEGGGAGYEFGHDGPVIDPGPVFRALHEDVSRGAGAAQVSARFHAGLARAFAGRARALVRDGEAEAVALTGGCFQNARLLRETLDALGDVPVLVHRTVPANDGGLALGQALVAAARVVPD